MSTAVLLIIALISFSSVVTAVAEGGQLHLIESGVQWNDTNGNTIHAHGGFVLSHANNFFWVGETDKALAEKGVNCYSSPDLYTWKFGGELINLNKIEVDNVSLAVLERPKLLWNQLTQKFVLLMHLDSSDYGFASVGIATSDSCVDWNNPCSCVFKFVKAIRPDGYESRDNGIYMEGDSAYLLFASGHVNTGLTIAKLQKDFLDVESPYFSQITGSFEAPTILHVSEAGLYYLFVSRTSGWAANDGRMFASSSLKGPWKQLGALSPSTDSYNSQPTYIIQHQQANNNNSSSSIRAIYLGDRWNYPDLAHASYVWLPINITSSTVSLWYEASWNMNDFLDPPKVVSE
eukprot:TRINITY_DN608_c0_g1_i1.p1 TRINITY_DN608_c0_g1~~TRINITY_DN608_c0_g1_i1.p1  ORF type:complete len:347 (-),score=87.69 TRINITY_DN608_c0_g1_i1:62-1102(-)